MLCIERPSLALAADLVIRRLSRSRVRSHYPKRRAKSVGFIPQLRWFLRDSNFIEQNPTRSRRQSRAT